MGLRSDHRTGTSYGRRGQTPVIPGTGQRFRCNLISAITNRGKLLFIVFTKEFRVPVFLTFLKRLLRQVRWRIFLILDRHPVHLAVSVPPNVKSDALGRRRPRDQIEMIDDVRGYLRSTQKRPDIVKAYFNEPHVRYAAA